MENPFDLTKFKSFQPIKQDFLVQITKITLNIKDENSCWFWSKGITSISPYGRISWGSKKYGAHVISYMIYNGPIPYNKIVRHTCNNKHCVNPKHLILGTYTDNAIDNIKDKTHPKAKLIIEDVKEIKQRLKHKIPGLIKELSLLYNVNMCVISNIDAGRRWTWVKV